MFFNVLKPRLLIEVALCTRARTSNELKISIEAARVACPETKDETHLLSLPLSSTLAEFDPADQRVRSGICSLELKCSATGKPGAILLMFPQSTPSHAVVNGRAATAGDAVNETRKQTSKGVSDG